MTGVTRGMLASISGMPVDASLWDDLLRSRFFEVIETVARVDSQLIAQLFKQHGPAVYRRALRMLGNAADAEEATQEIFIRVVRAADGFEDRSQVTTWLYQIATNYCLNVLRDRKRHATAYEEHIAPEAESQQTTPAAPDDMAMLRTLLAKAPEREAAAVICVHLDGMSHEEAAVVLGVSKRTVGNLIERFQAWMTEQEGS
jgi:RNA polymerase sigma-70 factor (ECF subfamily)